MSQTVDLAKLLVTLEAQNAKYIKDLEKAEQRTDRWEASTKKAVSEVKKWLGSVGLAAAAVKFIGMVRGTQEAIDKQAKLAESFGLTQAEMAGLEVGAGRAEVELDQLTTGITKFLRGFADAKNGLKAPLETLHALGLELKDLEGLSTFDMLQKVSDQLGKVDDEATRLNLSMDLFGKQGLKLGQFLTDGDVATLASLVNEAERLGQVVSDVDLKRIDDANDSVEDMGTAASGIARTFAVELAPAVETVSGWLTTMLTTINGGLKEGFNVIKFIAQETAAWVNGAAIGDLPRLYEDLAAAQEKLGRLQREQRAGILFFGPDQKDIDAAQADIERLQTLIKLSEELAASAANKPPEPPKVDPDPDGIGIKVEDIDAILAKLQQEVALYGKVGEAARLSYLMQHGLVDNITQADIDRVAALDAQLAALVAQTEQEKLLQQQTEAADKARQDAAAAVEQIRRQGMTEEQQKAEELLDIYAQLQNAVAMGIIRQDEANSLFRQFEARTKEVEGGIKILQEAVSEGARGIHGALSDFLFDPFNEGLDGMLKGALNTFKRIIAEAVATKAMLEAKEWLTGFAGKGGIMGALGTFAGMFDSGGRIGSGQFGVVAERRAEFVDMGGEGFLLPGPADITGGAETAAMMAQGGGDVGVTIINNGEAMRVTSQRSYNDGQKRMLEVVVETVKRSLRGGEFDDELTASFGISRANGSIGG